MPTCKIIYGAGPSDFYQFDDLIGDLQPKLPQIEVIVRAGRPGEQLRDTGVRALPSQVATLEVVATRAAAIDAIAEYAALIDGLPHEVIQHGQSFGFFRVVAIVPKEPRPCANYLGSVSGLTSGFLLAVTWTLIGTDPPPEEGP